MNRPLSLSHSFAYCTALARRRAGNFYYAFLMLPHAERRAMCALYAFMRVADDIADETGELADKRRALADWRTRLDAALAGRFDHSIHPALADTVRRFGIEPAHLHGLLDGVEQDLVQNHYATFAELYRYCYRVASLVGLCCVRIWGCRNAEADQLAEWSGIAFQLTNILRDVPEDAKLGRVYIPQQDLNRFGISADQLRAGSCDERYRQLMTFEVERAREYYRRASPLLAYLPPPGRAVFQIMTRTYRGLLDELERRGFEQANGPVRVSRWRKLGFLLEALPTRLGWM